MVTRSIAARLIAPLLISMILHFGLAGAVIYGQNSVTVAEARVAVAQERVIRLSELRSVSRSLQRDALNLIFEEDPSERAFIARKFDTRMTSFVSGLTELARKSAVIQIPPSYFQTQHFVARQLMASAGQANNGARSDALTTFRQAVRPAERDASRLADNLIEQSEAKVVALRASEAKAKDFSHVIIAVSLFAMAIAMVLLLDLLRNIMPALRRFEAMLHRLAADEIDFEFGNFELLELRALLKPLEKFRGNAVAVRNLAFTDAATGLKNRHAFVAEAGALLQQAEGAQGYVVVIADVDRFKHVNDDHGRVAGDALISAIGARMISLFAEPALVARIGGDEFALCVPVSEHRPAAMIGTELVEAMATPFALETFSVVITISAGLAEANPAHCAIESLIAQADMALYASKRGGRNRATVFTAELEKHRMVTRALECDLATAIERDEMRLVYQPIVALDGSKCEVEALARWLHPVLGEISPNQFIAAAERTGQIVPVGRWIMERALSDLQAWPWLTLSINISPVQLQQEGFVSFMLQACRAHGVPAARLVLEVTESLSIERNYRAQTALELLRTSGFRIALDDFGTGYSSLGMIKAMQFDRIKLDRSLIAGLGSDAASDAVFGAAVAMARSLGTETVAEGISDADVLAQISEFGITHAQGYYYSRPLERAAVPGFYAAEASGLARVA